MSKVSSAAPAVLAAAVTAAALGGLGADLTQTAYLAAHTAQTVVLSGNV